MTIQPLHHISLVKELIEETLRGFELTGVQAWTPTLALLACTSAQSDRSGRYATIAAKALQELDPALRATFLEGYEIPTNVRQADPNVDWPAPKADPYTDTFDLEEYKRRMLMRLNRVAEEQSHRLLFGGDRLAHTYRYKFYEADFVLDSADPEALTAADIPYIFYEAQALGKTHVECAQGIATEAAVAKGWDAQYAEPARQVGQRDIKAATDVAEADAAYTTAVGAIEASMSALLSAIAQAQNPEPE